MSLLWALFSLLGAFCQSGSRLVNQFLKLPGAQLVLAVKFLMAVYVFPFALFCSWPSELWFYIWIGVQAPCVYIMERRRQNLVSRYGGGAVGRLEPLSLPLLFLLWFAVKPELLMENLQDPLRFAGIAIMIGGIAFFSMRLRHCEVSIVVMGQMLPVVICIALVSMFAKLAIDYGVGVDAVIVYVFLQSAFSSFVAVIVHFVEGKHSETALPRVFDKRLWKGAALLAVVVCCGVSARMLGVQSIDNPAYVNAIVATSPFWVILFYRLFGHEDRGDVFSGLGVVVCGIAMTVIVIS